MHGPVLLLHNLVLDWLGLDVVAVAMLAGVPLTVWRESTCTRKDLFEAVIGEFNLLCIAARVHEGGFKELKMLAAPHHHS